MRISDESIDKNIDRSFNHLVFRLLGYQDLQKAKILKGNYDSKDFLYNYSVINIDGRQVGDGLVGDKVKEIQRIYVEQIKSKLS